MNTMNMAPTRGMRVVLAFLALSIAQSAMAKPEAGKALQPDGSSGARIALQYVGKNIVTAVTGPGAGQAFTVGYFTYVAGFPQAPFSDPNTADETTAHFTFRSEPYSFSTIPNENTLVRTVVPGFLLKVYFNEAPDQSFDDPDTFSDGQLIATFEVITSQATRVENEASEQASVRLISSKPLLFQGKNYNIRNIVHGGLTLLSTGSAVPLDVLRPVFAFSGSALAY